MKITVDTQQLQHAGLIDTATAQMLEQHAIRNTDSTAINLLIAFGVAVLAAGMLAMFPEPTFAAFFGGGFIALGLLVKHQYGEQWEKLGAIWCILGALLFAGSIGTLINQPFVSSLLAAVVFAAMAMAAKSKFLAALVPLALAAMLGGSTGYWHACYSIGVSEPTLTIAFFTLLGCAAWQWAKKAGKHEDLLVIFARMCAILVNFGFWVGSLWGDRMGDTWQVNLAQIDAVVFVVAWALALAAAGLWAAKNGRRFLVNTVAVFGSIHFYTQWFEHLGGSPFTVMVAGAITIAIGLALWRYNRQEIGLYEQPV